MTESNTTSQLSVDAEFIDQISLGYCKDPFSYLGIHETEAGVIIRAFLPEAEKARVISAKGRSLKIMERIEGTDMFVAELKGKKRTLAYRLLVEFEDGEEVDMEDPYRFESNIGEMDNWLLAEGKHNRPYEKLGAHFVTQNGVSGVSFAVWAPNARRVSVVGEFNFWDGRRHQMRFHPSSGIWDIFVPNVAEGALYKFELLDSNGDIRIKSDPYAFGSQMRPETASKVTGLPAMMKPSKKCREANNFDKPISVYEVHLGSWRRNLENNYWLSYEELGDELIPYVKDMGFTHIELLPITEFPFDGSWGYQSTGIYSPTSRFGSPDGLRKFIQKAHKAGITVILDWVVGHFPTDEHGLTYFDGTHLYEYADPKEGFHQDWNTLIFNYDRHEVKNYLVGNALYWVERFGIDALRVDAVASMVYRDYSREDGQWIPNRYGGRENLEALDFLRDTNRILAAEGQGGVTIAEESTSFPGVTHDVEYNGLGFNYKWNMGWMNDTLRYMKEEPIHRKYHHNLMTFGMVYQYSEKFMLPISHDEVVHGKCSMLGKMPGDCWQQFANLRAYYGYMWGYPGKKLLFMGCEFAQGREWNYEESLDWFLLNEEEHGGWHKGMLKWVKDLNHFYQKTPALYEQDYNPEGFDWLVVDDAEQSVFAFERNATDGSSVIVINNFTPVVRENYRVGVRVEGTYEEVLNSDDATYMGSNIKNGKVESEEIPSHDKEASISVTLPPLSTIFLVRTKAKKAKKTAKAKTVKVTKTVKTKAKAKK